jgi:hypothetical protein
VLNLQWLFLIGGTLMSVQDLLDTLRTEEQQLTKQLAGIRGAISSLETGGASPAAIKRGPGRTAASHERSLASPEAFEALSKGTSGDLRRAKGAVGEDQGGQEIAPFHRSAVVGSDPFWPCVIRLSLSSQFVGLVTDDE